MSALEPDWECFLSKCNPTPDDCCALVSLTGILHYFNAGLVIRPNSLDILFNKSDPLKYAQYVQHLESFLQSKCTSA